MTVARLYLLTPLRDEAGSFTRLYQALAAQSLAIDGWFLLENNSCDGTVELCDQLQPQGAIKNIYVRHERDSASYELGLSYAQRIARGLCWVRETVELTPQDIIGILDADVIPTVEYYQILMRAFDEYPALGLTSGVAYHENGKKMAYAPEWVMGNCRLWRVACIDQTGYIIGPGADALCQIKAEVMGWHTAVQRNATVTCRPPGARAGYAYYGYTAYYRGETLGYIFIRALYNIVRGHFSGGLLLFYGYLNAFVRQHKRTDDIAIINYSRTKIIRKISRFLKRIG